MYKNNFIFLSLCYLLLFGNITSNPTHQRIKDENEFNLFDPKFWSSLLDDYFSDSDDESSAVPENFRPVVVCNPPNCTIVINVQNGHNTGVIPKDTGSSPTVHPIVTVAHLPVHGSEHSAAPHQASGSHNAGNTEAPHTGVPSS